MSNLSPNPSLSVQLRIVYIVIWNTGTSHPTIFSLHSRMCELILDNNNAYHLFFKVLTPFILISALLTTRKRRHTLASIIPSFGLLWQHIQSPQAKIIRRPSTDALLPARVTPMLTFPNIYTNIDERGSY
jgi:hypothetical protein